MTTKPVVDISPKTVPIKALGCLYGPINECSGHTKLLPGDALIGMLPEAMLALLNEVSLVHSRNN